MSQQTLIHELFFLLMIFTSILSSLPIANTLTLDMVRRDSFDFNLFPKNLSGAQTSRIFARLSHSRARRLAGQLPIVSKFVNSSVVIDTIQPPMKQFFDSMFAVSVDIGSRPIPYRTYLALDTGSDLVWVQCQGCTNCFHIKNGPFNQTASTSYRKMTIYNHFCTPRVPVNGTDCRFNIMYGTGHVVGVRSLDSLQFHASDRPYVTIKDMVFGCADRVTNLTFGGHNDGMNNSISGIFGLALGYQKYGNTFMDLSRHLTKMKFSYCLPPWNAPKSKAIPLSFGDDVPRLPPGTQTTPMKNNMYYLNVNDLSIGGHRLHLDPSIFRLRRDNTGGFIIDSGCGVTFLADSAYRRVEHEMVAILDRQKNKRVDPTSAGYTLCYKWPLKVHNNSLSITYHMENANLEVIFRDLFIRVNVDGKYIGCMTIMSTDDVGPSLLGAANQADYRFVYDLGHESLHFHRVQC